MRRACLSLLYSDCSISSHCKASGGNLFQACSFQGLSSFPFLSCGKTRLPQCLLLVWTAKIPVLVQPKTCQLGSLPWRRKPLLQGRFPKPLPPGDLEQVHHLQVDCSHHQSAVLVDISFWDLTSRHFQKKAVKNWQWVSKKAAL